MESKRKHAQVSAIIAIILLPVPLLIDQLYTRTRFTSDVTYHLDAGVPGMIVDRVQHFDPITAGNWTFINEDYKPVDFFSGTELDRAIATLDYRRGFPFHYSTLETMHLIYNFTAKHFSTAVNISCWLNNYSVPVVSIQGNPEIGWWNDLSSSPYQYTHAFFNASTFAELTTAVQSMVLSSGCLTKVVMQQDTAFTSRIINQWFVISDAGDIMLAIQKIYIWEGDSGG